MSSNSRMANYSAPANTPETKKYTEAELQAMTIANIKSLASELGYSINATLKADIIAEFLRQQG